MNTRHSFEINISNSKKVFFGVFFDSNKINTLNFLKLSMLATEKTVMKYHTKGGKSYKKFGKNKKKFQNFNDYPKKFTKNKNKYGKKFNFKNKYVKNFKFKKYFNKPKKKPIFQKLFILKGGSNVFISSFFSPFKLKIWRKDLINFQNLSFFKNWYKTFFVKTLLYKIIGLRNLWKSLLVTIADLKMWAMLEHYDYFGLYSTSRNYMSVHSELNPKKSLFWLLPTFIRNWFINEFFWKVYRKRNFKFKKFRFFWKFMRLRLKPQAYLEFLMLKKIYLPLYGWKFEKTDPIQRFFFLTQYEIFWKLIPHASRDFLGYMSKTTRYEKYLYAYPYHYSALFFRNFIWYISNWKRTRFLNFRKYKSKFHHKNVLFSLANMLMSKVSANRFTKWTDAHFSFPFKYVKILLSKIFENKKNWLVASIYKNKSFSKSRSKLLEDSKNVIQQIRLMYSLNWSSGKRFVWKALEHETFSKLDYFKTAKYVWRDLVVDSFTPFVRKDFYWYAEKFSYDSMNFNYKRLLWKLFPHQKIIEYNLLRSNNLYNYVSVTNVNWKFFSLLKIFWGDWAPKKNNLASYNIRYPANFDFKTYEFNENLVSFLHDIDVSQIFYTHPYEIPYTYYREIFFASKKTWGFEFFFSKNLVLASSIIWFPILLSSWYYVERFYFLMINKADFKELSLLRDTVKLFPSSANPVNTILYKRYLDQFLSFKRVYLFLIKLLENKFIKKNNFYKNLLLGQTINRFGFNKVSNSSKVFFLVYLLYFFDFLQTKTKKSRILVSVALQDVFWQFFFFTHWTKDLFKPSNMVIKPYFTQSLKSIKKYPVTQYRFIGTRKTSSSGILTAFGYSFNVFAAPVYFNLTISWNNPNYFSQDVKKEQSYSFSPWISLSNLVYEDLWERFATVLFDRVYEILKFKNYKVNNSKFLNSEFFYNIKDIIFNIYPKNILDKWYFKFWYNYILDFDNQSINVLTSKMWRNTKLNSFFIGPLTIMLSNTNWKLLENVSSTEHKYLSTLMTLSTLEAQALTFPDFVFPFQFDYKKFTLGRKHRLLRVYYEDSYFFFLKDSFFKSFNSGINYFEMEILSAFTNSLFLNLTRHANLANYTFSHFDKEQPEVKLFPDSIFWDMFFNKFKFWWLYFGFSDTFRINRGLISNYNSFLLVLLHLSRALINNRIIVDFFWVQNLFNDTDIFFSDFGSNLLHKNFLFKHFFYNDRLFLKKKLVFLRLNNNMSAISNFSFYNGFLHKFSASNFYFFSNEDNLLTSFNSQLGFNSSKGRSFFFELIENCYDSFTKKIFFKFELNKFKLLHVFWNAAILVSNFVWNVLFFKFKFKITNSFNYCSYFSFVWLKQTLSTLLNIYLSWKDYIFSNFLDFFKKKILLLLFLTKLLFIVNKFSSFLLKWLLYLYYLNIFFFKKFINRFRIFTGWKFLNYYFKIFFVSKLLVNKWLSTWIFVNKLSFYNNLFLSIYAYWKKLGNIKFLFYSLRTRISTIFCFNKSLFFFTHLLYDFIINHKLYDYSFHLSVSGINYYSILNTLYFSNSFLLNFFWWAFYLVLNVKKITRHNFFYQFTKSKIGSVLLGEGSNYSYKELLWKLSVQILLNSRTLLLLDWNLFWFPFSQKYNYVFFFFTFTRSIFSPTKTKTKFCFIKQKTLSKQVSNRNLFTYVNRYVNKWFKAIVYIKKLVSFFLKMWKRRWKMKFFWKLVSVFTQNKLLKTKAEMKFFKTDTPKHLKSAKAITNFKLKWNRQINTETLWFFWDKILKKIVFNFLFKLIKKWHIPFGHLDASHLDLFYLQFFNMINFLSSQGLIKKTYFTFLTKIINFFAKSSFLFFKGQNFFFNISSILKIRRLNLLLSCFFTGKIINNSKYLKYGIKNETYKSWNIRRNFVNWINLIKIILLSYWLFSFMNLAVYGNFFHYKLVLRKFTTSLQLLFYKFFWNANFKFKLFSYPFLLGICSLGASSITSFLGISASCKKPYVYKNYKISLSPSIFVYKNFSLSLAKSLISILFFWNDNAALENCIYFKCLPRPSFILIKPNAIGARLQNFELVLRNVRYTNLAFNINTLLLKNSKVFFTIQFLIGLFFFIFLRVLVCLND